MTNNIITKEQAVEDLRNRVHFVNQARAANMLNKIKGKPHSLYKVQRGFAVLPFNVPRMPESLTYYKNAIDELLSPEGCIGLRIYPAMDANNQFALLLVAVDEQGDDILGDGGTSLVPGGRFIDEGQTCPPYPRSGRIIS